MHWLTWLVILVGQTSRSPNFNHIPAAQWVITKNGTATASITIQNREFNDLSDNAVGLNKKTVQLYVKIAKDVFFYNNGVADTLSFILLELI